MKFSYLKEGLHSISIFPTLMKFLLSVLALGFVCRNGSSTELSCSGTPYSTKAVLTVHGKEH